MHFDPHNVLAGLQEHDWNARCITKLSSASASNFSHGTIHFVGAEGRRMSDFTNDTWGITIGDCYQYCNAEEVPYVSCFLFLVPTVS